MLITFFLLQALQSAAIVSKPILPARDKLLTEKATPTVQELEVAGRNFGALPPSMTSDNEAESDYFLNELNSAEIQGEVDPVEYDLKIAKELGAMKNRQQLQLADRRFRFSSKPDGQEGNEVHERKLYSANDDRRPAELAEGGIFHGVLVFLGYCLLFLLFVAFFIGLTAFFKHETKPRKKKKNKNKANKNRDLDDFDSSTKHLDLDSISEKEEVSQKANTESSINQAGNEGGSVYQESPNSFIVPLPNDDEERGERYRQRRKIRRAQRKRRRELRKRRKRKADPTSECIGCGNNWSNENEPKTQPQANSRSNNSSSSPCSQLKRVSFSQKMRIRYIKSK